MFTGIVEARGVVTARTDTGESSRFTIDLGAASSGLVIGDSVAVNGCCLTVAALEGSVATFDVMTESLRVTALGELVAGSEVNLEPARRLGDKLGGHLVSGHIDTVGVVSRIDPGDDCHVVSFDVPETFHVELVLRGSVAVDGVSLTVMRVDPGSFSVSIIPHTWSVTRFHDYVPGTRVNLEADQIGKLVRHHVERLLGDVRGG